MTLVLWTRGVFAAALCFGPAIGTAQAAQSDAAQLAKQLSNPIASLINVPFQLNHDEGYGTGPGKRTYLNVQPVIPITLNSDWNLISRTIVPITYQTDFGPETESPFGLGDTVQSFFMSPQKPGPGGLIWGVGPVFLVPTATDGALGGEKWGAGLTGVGLVQRGGWTVGALANHIWSFAGEDDRDDISSTFLQPFASYTTSKATSFGLNTESTYIWETEDWSVPVNFQVNQLLKLGNHPVQTGGGVRYWAESPTGGADDLGVRLSLVLLYPR